MASRQDLLQCLSMHWPVLPVCSSQQAVDLMAVSVLHMKHHRTHHESTAGSATGPHSSGFDCASRRLTAKETRTTCLQTSASSLLTSEVLTSLLDSSADCRICKECSRGPGPLDLTLLAASGCA